MTTCPHCGEQHPESAKFCSATGQPMPAPVVTERVRPLGDPKGVFDLLREAFELYRAHWRPLLATAALLFLPGALLTAWMVPLAGTNLRWLFGKALTALFLYGVVLAMTQGALTIAAAERTLEGADTGWREPWALLLRRLPTLASALGLAAPLLAVGYFLAIVPGLVLAFFFAFVAPVALLEGKGGSAALRRSYELVRSDWLRTAIMLVAFGVTNALAHWIASLFTPDGSGLASFLGNLLLLAAMPVPIIGSALLYLDLRRKADGVTDDDLRVELETLRAT